MKKDGMSGQVIFIRGPGQQARIIIIIILGNIGVGRKG